MCYSYYNIVYFILGIKYSTYYQEAFNLTEMLDVIISSVAGSTAVIHFNILYIFQNRGLIIIKKYFTPVNYNFTPYH